MRAIPRLVSVLATIPLLMAATSEVAQYDPELALSASRAALGRSLQDLRLRDVDGQTFELGQLRGRPVVISMIYTSCHHVCPTITRNVQNKVDIAREALGDEAFSVVTVGFDWKVDTPDRMNIYRRQFGIDDPHWHFLSGDAATIDTLAA
ncbi:MAG: SCO family protein, partial [Woeseiaceae bacterium]|nr:SCO family protein [Woeseiaceae bacterium]